MVMFLLLSVDGWMDEWMDVWIDGRTWGGCGCPELEQCLWCPELSTSSTGKTLSRMHLVWAWWWHVWKLVHHGTRSAVPSVLLCTGKALTDHHHFLPSTTWHSGQQWAPSILQYKHPHSQSFRSPPQQLATESESDDKEPPVGEAKKHTNHHRQSVRYECVSFSLVLMGFLPPPSWLLVESAGRPPRRHQQCPC